MDVLWTSTRNDKQSTPSLSFLSSVYLFFSHRNEVEFPSQETFLVAKSNTIRSFFRPSVGPSIGPWVRHAFLKYRGNGDFKTKHQGTHSIAFLVEIQENSARLKKIQENLAIYWTHCSSN